MLQRIKYTGALFCLLFAVCFPVMGQDTSFLLSGYSSAGFEANADESSLLTGNFATTFLWSHSDRFLFEGETEIGYGHGGSFEIGLEYATLAYILNDYLTFRAGKFLSPFNTFNERMHPTWINKMPTNPLGMGGHDPVGPASEFGVELRGGARIGGPKINYALFVTNGPALNKVEDAVSPSASINYANPEDNNIGKAVGGRLGFLPFSNSALEVGISGHYAGQLGTKETAYEDISMFSWSSDIIWHLRGIEFLHGNIDLRGQINTIDLDQFNLQSGTEAIAVNLDQQAYYGQIAYRPVMSGSSLLSNTELIVRYSALDLPLTQFGEDDHADESEETGDGHAHKVKSEYRTLQSTLSGSGADAILNTANESSIDQVSDQQTQWAFGINYWLSWRTVVKVSYQLEELGGQRSDALLIQFATGL